MAQKQKVKKREKMDSYEVAAKQSHESEVKYIAHRYHIPIKEVRKAMLAVGKNGKPCRSRWKIYAELRAMGYEIKTRYNQ